MPVVTFDKEHVDEFHEAIALLLIPFRHDVPADWIDHVVGTATTCTRVF